MNKFFLSEMRIVYISITFIFFLFLLIPFFLSFLIREIPNDIQHSLEGTQMIYKDFTVTQYFTSQLSNLSGIGTSIKNPDFRNRKDLILNLYSDDKSLVRTVNLNGANILDGDFIVIRFEPISNSKGKKYSIQFSAPESESSESLEIFLSSQKPSWIEDLYINANKSDSKIPFVTYHRPSNVLSIAREVFVQVLKRLFADLPFAISYILLIGILITYLFYLRKKY